MKISHTSARRLPKQTHAGRSPRRLCSSKQKGFTFPSTWREDQALRSKYRAEHLIGKPMRALVVNRPVIPFGDGQMVLDFLGNRQLQNLRRWVQSKKNSEQKYMAVVFELDSTSPNSNRQDAMYGKTAVIIRVKRDGIRKEERGDEFPTLKYEGIDRIEYNDLGLSGLGFPVIRVINSYRARTEIPKKIAPKYDEHCQAILELAEGLSTRNPNRFRTFYNAVFRAKNRRSFYQVLFRYLHVICDLRDLEAYINLISFSSGVKFLEAVRNRLQEITSEETREHLQRPRFNRRELARAWVPQTVIGDLDQDLEILGQPEVMLDQPAYFYASDKVKRVLKFPWNKYIAPSEANPEKMERTLRRGIEGLNHPINCLMDNYDLGVSGAAGRSDPFVLVLVGPPGIAKTILAKKFAKGLGLPWSFIPFGSITFTELMGSSATFVSAQPSIVTRKVTEAQCLNPVIIGDELDKGLNNNKQRPDRGGGNIEGAMIAFLDPNSNREIEDPYFNVKFPFNRVNWIFTSNTWDDLPTFITGRAIPIFFEPYTFRQKLAVAENILVHHANRLTRKKRYSILFPREVLERVLNEHYHEGGSRLLEKALKRIALRVARFNPEATPENPVKVQVRDVWDVLRVENAQRPRKRVGPTRIGSAWGVGVDEISGVVEENQVSIHPISPNLPIPWFGNTGLLDRDIEETTKTIRQLVYLKYHDFDKYFDPNKKDKKEINIARDQFWQSQIAHHMPPAGEQTGGPSGGILETVSLLSALFKKPVHPGIVFTGEIDKFGDVKQIGGERLKMQAMYHQGATIAVFPSENRKGAVLALEEIAQDSLLDKDRALELRVFPKDFIPGADANKRYWLEKKSEPGKPVFTLHLVENIEEVLPLAFPKNEES